MNGDGKIDIEDLSTSLKLKGYAGFTSATPFPTKPLPPDSGRAVVRAVRNAMVAKRLNYYDAFRQFDSNGNGMLSYKELCDGLDTVIQLSQEAKDGLFAIMDKQGIGIIDYPKFLAVLKNTEIDEIKHQDNWGWENGVIRMIKEWIARENLVVDDAFRTFDRDFDGIISKNDLRHGLINVLRFEEKEVLDLRIDRLYKLLDTYKRNSIQISDFKALFEEET
jgi:Ca2+-binding EF-hand superfamily protein